MFTALLLAAAATSGFPTVDLIEPATIQAYQPVELTITGSGFDADCRVHGIDGLRIADGSVMPTIPSGNTYLGCVMIAERIAAKFRADVQ